MEVCAKTVIFLSSLFVVHKDTPLSFEKSDNDVTRTIHVYHLYDEQYLK